MFKSNKSLWAVGLFLLSLSIRLALLDYTYIRIIEADGVGYIGDAKAFLEGFDIRNINIINHPVFPVLIAFFSYITPDWETAGRMVGIVSGSLIGPVAFLISTARGNSLKVSAFSAIFVSVAPEFVISSFQVFNDTLNCLLLLIGVWQLMVAIKNGKKANFFFSGLSFALAYLTRPDSIVPSFFAFLFLIYYLLKSVWIGKKSIAYFSLFAFGFAILAVPYLLYLHSQVGKWVITGRQIAAQTNLPALTGGGNYEDANYGLTEDLTLKGDVQKRLETEGADIRKGFIGMWLEDPKGRMTSLGDNLKIEWAIFGGIPWYITLFALLPIIISMRGFLSNNWPLLLYSTPLFFLYPFFWADGRHIFHFLFPLWLWAAEGVEIIKNKVGEKISSLPLSLLEYLIYTSIVIALVSSFNPKVFNPKELNYLRQKEMGVWISKNTPKDAVVMARWGRLTFYTDRKTVMFPYAEWETIKRYIKKNGVTHLIVDESFSDIRPQVRHILTPIFSGSSVSPDDSLSIIRIKRDRFGGMIVYEVKK